MSMELKLVPDVKVAVEMNGESLVNLENGIVYESIALNEAYLFIKSAVDGKEIKIKFLKKEEAI
jgi:hypothetical protein